MAAHGATPSPRERYAAATHEQGSVWMQSHGRVFAAFARATQAPGSRINARGYFEHQRSISCTQNVSSNRPRGTGRGLKQKGRHGR